MEQADGSWIRTKRGNAKASDYHRWLKKGRNRQIDVWSWRCCTAIRSPTEVRVTVDTRHDQGLQDPVPDYGLRARGANAMKVREVIRLLAEDGWFLVETHGSHRQYKHPVKRGRVTVHGKPSHDLAPGTLNSILKQAGLKE